MFYGQMAKRKSSRALLRNMTRSSGLLSTLRRGRKIRMEFAKSIIDIATGERLRDSLQPVKIPSAQLLQFGL